MTLWQTRRIEVVLMVLVVATIVFGLRRLASISDPLPSDQVGWHVEGRVQPENGKHRVEAFDRLDSSSDTLEKLHVATAVCVKKDIRLLHELTKSMLFSSQHVVALYVFTHPQLQSFVVDEITRWPFAFGLKLEPRVYNLTMPKEWSRDIVSSRYLCDLQPFTLPDSLPTVQRVLWVHVDSLFLAPLEEVWSHFRFLSPRFALAATANRQRQGGSYVIASIRTEVLLLQLAVMRRTNWTTPLLHRLSASSRSSRQLDAALIRHVLLRPDSVYWLPCELNFGAELCESSVMCGSLRRSGVVVLRGAGRAAATNSEPALAAVLGAFRKFRLGVDCNRRLPFYIRDAVSSWFGRPCAFLPKMYVQRLDDFLKTLSRQIPDINCVF